MRKNIILGISLICVATLMGCGVIEKEDEIKIMSVKGDREDEVAEETLVMKGDISYVNSVSIIYKSSEKSTLNYKISGEPFYKNYVKKGDEVKKGQLLAELDVSKYQDAIDDLTDQAAQLKVQISENDSLISVDPDNKASYQADRDSMSRELTAINQEIAENETARNERQIYADMDGIVTMVKEFNVGDLSNENDIVITIVGLDRKLIGSTEVIQGLEVGMELDMESADKVYPVKVVSITPVEDTKKQEIVLEFVENMVDITDGMSGKISYTVKEAKNVLYVPANTVFESSTGHYVYVNNKDGFREEKEVEVGEVIGDNIIITKGLSEGDVILAN